ncbi:MAG: hypothetical protein J6X53_05490, partial [Abditibacteriota bacterium]|nr:hypothetical protein [Abditibacteriota bacterium]
MNRTNDKTALFETAPVPSALAVMALPTIVSQLITLIYNIADTWFIGRTKNPYMIAACSLVLTVFLAANSLASLFGVGGGSLMVRLLGSRREDEARKAASWSLSMSAFSALAFSLLCLLLMNPLLRLLGASDNTIGYARQYLLFVVILGGVPTVLSVTMGTMIRNVGYSREAGFGLSMGGVLNILLDPVFMFVLLPDGYQVMGAGIATMLSNVASFVYFVLVYRRISKNTVLELPKRIEKLERPSRASLFSVGIPAALALFLFDLTNIFIYRLTSAYGDIELAAVGIVLKAERLPLNVGIGICLGMVPLVAYNYAAGNYERMRSFFSAARFAGVSVSVLSVIFYRIFAPVMIQIFIDDAETVYYGTQFLRIRCLATPFMFLSFHMVHFMQSVDRGGCSLWLVVIRQL